MRYRRAINRTASSSLRANGSGRRPARWRSNPETTLRTGLFRRYAPRNDEAFRLHSSIVRISPESVYANTFSTSVPLLNRSRESYFKILRAWIGLMQCCRVVAHLPSTWPNVVHAIRAETSDQGSRCFRASVRIRRDYPETNSHSDPIIHARSESDPDARPVH